MVQTAQEAAGTIYGNLQKKKKDKLREKFIFIHIHVCFFSPLLIHNFGFFTVQKDPNDSRNMYGTAST